MPASAFRFASSGGSSDSVAGSMSCLPKSIGRAFAATAQGFSYRAGVWHLPIASLLRSVPVLGFMYEDGTPKDCVWATVAPTTLVAG